MEPQPKALLPLPPLTVENSPPAWFWVPPATLAPLPVALFCPPPLTLESSPKAWLSVPPLTL